MHLNWNPTVRAGLLLAASLPLPFVSCASSTITQAPDPTVVQQRLYPRKTSSSAPPYGRNACSALYSVYSWCSTSGYVNLGGSSALASCACYYDQTWVPNIFDELVTSCYDYVRTVQPAATGGIAQYLNICFLAGDISKSASQGSLACNTLASILTSCANPPRTRSSSSALIFSGSSSLANCACYSASKYVPDNFDHLVSSCYTYAQNLAGEGAAVSTLVGFCGSVGDVRQSASTALQKCQLFDNQYAACESAYSGVFSTLTASQQASCLCYGARESWEPGVVDGAIQTCIGYLSTANPQRARTIEVFGNGFCEGLGDVRHPSSTNAIPGRTTSIVLPTITATKNSTLTVISTLSENNSETSGTIHSTPASTTALLPTNTIVPESAGGKLVGSHCS
ncbi:hypothetical protein TWF694_011275 [Orbilia ellipsospora]|uniref:Uncharacterized protein n=1 Tax=Orbilia ellipsospora TaxID=2528407 RepID=A0AAV9XEW8_9PEZI